MLALILLTGCDRLDAAGDVVDGLGDTTVVQGIFLGAEIPFGIELPDDAGIYTSFCKVFLAQVSDANDVTDAPVSGADVAFVSQETGKLGFDETDDGEYRLYSQDGLVYEPGQTAKLQFSLGNETGSLSVTAPEAPEFDLDNEGTSQEAQKVKVTSGRFQNLVVAVYDLDRDKLTWDNLPDDFESGVELNDEDAEPIDELIVPGEAFPRGSTYLVGVGGLEVGDATEFEGVNQALSAFGAGRMTLHMIEITGANAKP
ncbi:hypothetical protein LBMAG42_42270 [Deltaproteobacteria bacterium]|nr:hypothetical protein LBMAG42_42270 [Deltaproteobacteria bacterium]